MTLAQSLGDPQSYASLQLEALPFFKTQGAGNDFVMLDCRQDSDFCLASIASRICDRNFAVGADGLIGLFESDLGDFRMQYHNADGSRSVCANGIRCLVRFVEELGGFSQEQDLLKIETDDGLKQVFRANAKDHYKVDMGRVRFESKEIPTLGEGEQFGVKLEVSGEEVEIYAAGVGNPHCIVFVDSVENAPVAKLGPLLESHPHFPERTNVEFVAIKKGEGARLRIWERGVGETLACGTANCAVFALGQRLGYFGREARLNSKGGEFLMESKGEDCSGFAEIFMTGPARIVFRGLIDLSL